MPSRPLPGHLISQFLSLTPHILSGLAGYFAWENQIEAIFHSQTASKSLQTQYLSHARENTPYHRFSFLLTPVHQYLLQSPNIRLYRRILTIIIIIALSEYFKSHLPACFNRRIPCSLLRRISWSLSGNFPSPSGAFHIPIKLWITQNFVQICSRPLAGNFPFQGIVFLKWKFVIFPYPAGGIRPSPLREALF